MRKARQPGKSPPIIKLGMFFLWTCIAILASCVPSAGQSNANDYEVEASYLYKFAKAGEWPRQVLQDGDPLVIGVVGGDEGFVDALTRAVSGKVAGTHPIVIKHLSATGELKSCQLLFFRSSEHKRVQEAITGLGPAPILLVGEDKSFLEQGGIINLFQENGALRFEIDADALERSEIHLGPQILTEARIQSSEALQTTTSRKIALEVPPDYPDLARQMKLRGTVQVEAIVEPDGKVKKVKLVGGHPVLAQAALQAVMKWRYEPGSQETIELVKVDFATH